MSPTPVIPTPGQFVEPVEYYSALITSEYQSGAPNFRAWLAANLQLGYDVGLCLIQLVTAYQLLPSQVATPIAVGTANHITFTVDSNEGIMPGNLVTGIGFLTNAFFAPNTYVTEVNGLTITINQPIIGSFSRAVVFWACAIGAQLDTLGVIVGANRSLAFQPTAIASGIVAVTINAAGSGYVAGDIVAVTQTGAYGAGAGGSVTVTTVNGSGAVTGISLLASGSTYHNATGASTSGGAGTGLTLNITTAVSVASGGSAYVVGDVITATQSGASNGQLVVTSVSAGVVTGVAALNFANIQGGCGNGYKVATGLSTSGGTGTGCTVNITQTQSPVLDDATFRVLLQCKVFANHWNGQIDTLTEFWASLFPGGTLTVTDGQNMTATITVTAAASIVVDMIKNGLMVPRPQGVKYTFSFPTLPMFGFDRQDSFIAGFGPGGGHFT